MSATPEKKEGWGEAGADNLFGPLERFYAKSGVELPNIMFVEGTSLPHPARELLVHKSDMTSTLRRFHGAEIGLRVCSVAEDDGALFRLVVLYRADNGAPVEFGAIRIALSAFAPEDRDLIVAGKEPLGGILERRGIPFTSDPRAYFRYGADAFVGVLLESVVDHPLYGRCNVLKSVEGKVLAEIVEILP